jgi:hypothetical protein
MTVKLGRPCSTSDPGSISVQMKLDQGMDVEDELKRWARQGQLLRFCLRVDAVV